MYLFFYRIRSYFIAFSIVAALGVLVPQSATAQSAGALVRVDPPTLEVGQGQAEQINIVIENAKDVYGIDVRAKFDPNLFEIADSDPATDGVQMIAGSFIKPDFMVRNTADNEKGTLQYVVTQVNPTPPANGSGVVVSLLVRGKTLGKSGALTIDYVQIADRSGKKLAVQLESGMISIVTAKRATPAITLTNTAPMSAPTVAKTRAAAATRTRATTAPGAAPSRGNTEALTNLALIGVALCGCLGAILILGLALFLLRRKPRAAGPVPPM